MIIYYLPQVTTHFFSFFQRITTKKGVMSRWIKKKEIKKVEGKKRSETEIEGICCCILKFIAEKLWQVT